MSNIHLYTNMLPFPPVSNRPMARPEAASHLNVAIAVWIWFERVLVLERWFIIRERPWKTCE